MTALCWRARLEDGDQRRIRALIDASTLEDGVAPVGEQVLRELSGDRTRHLVAVDPDQEGDNLVGYLNLSVAAAPAGPTAELVVAPKHRRHGLGSAMVAAALTEGGPGTRIWAHGNLDAARHTAAALNLRPVRELLQMSRSLRGLPRFAVPAAVDVRTYRGESDDAEFLRVNNAAFDWHPEQGGWITNTFTERRAQTWFDPAGLFLAFDRQGTLRGFHWTKVHSDRAGVGEVYVLAVDPAAQGGGLGRALTLVGLDHLARRLADHADPVVILYTESDNAAAVHTYEQLGFVVSGVDTAYGRG